MKKKIGLAWALFSVILLFAAGCARDQRQAYPAQVYWLILDQYRQLRNVTFSFRLGDDADYEKALVHTFESGDLPDIILKVWPANIDAYANAGLLLAFSDYLDQMPHFRAYIAAHGLEAELDRFRHPDGKLYLLPGFQRRIQVQQWIYRKDLFSKHALSAPRTYDELFDSLVMLKGLYPDSIPISGAWGGAHLFAMMGAGYGITAGWNGTICYTAPTDRWVFAPATENFSTAATPPGFSILRFSRRAMWTLPRRCRMAG